MKSQLKQKKKMKFLLQLSLTSGRLDGQKIAFIAKTLKRNELGAYLLLLEKKLRQERVIVITAIPIPTTFMNSLKKLFSGKEILFKKDSRIIAGMQVFFADYLFNASFSYFLEKVRKSYEVS